MDRWAPVGLGMVAGVAAWPSWPVGADVAWGVACLGLAVAVWGAAVGGRRRVEAALLVAGLGLGGAAVGVRAEGPRLRGPVAVVGVVAGAPTGRVAVVDVARWRPRGGAWRAGGGAIQVRLPERGVPTGAHVVLAGIGRPVEANVLPGAPDPARAARLQRIRTVVHATTARVLGPSPAPPLRPMHGLLRALATGDRRDVDPAWLDTLRGTGTAHLLAISGFHVGTVAAAAWFAARALAGVVAVWRPVGLSEAITRLPPVLAAAGFAAAVGWPVSAQRAVALVALVALRSAVGRPLPPVAGLGLAAAAVIVLDPGAVAGPSFQLSFGAVLGLVTWGAAWSPLARGPWPVRRAIGGVLVSTAATVGTLAPAAWWFQAVAPWSPVANLVAMPWTAMVLAPCGFAAALVPGPLGDGAAFVGAWAADLLIAVLDRLVVAPWRPAVGAGGALALCALYGLSRHPGLAAAWTLCVLGLRPVAGVPRIVIPDVGQGGAVLVEHGDGRVDLVDAGRGWAGVDAWLRRRGVWHLDRVIVSHSDDDHAGGVAAILGSLTVGAVYVAGDPPEEVARAAAAAGVPVHDGPPDRLHPVDARLWSDNDASVVLSVAVGPWRLLLPGDIEADAEAVVAARAGPHDIVVLPHHGSATSSTDMLLDAVRPSLAIAQAGRGNWYGHPHRSVQRRVAARGIRLLRTDVLGTITLRAGPSGIEGETWRAGTGTRPLRPHALVGP